MFAEGTDVAASGAEAALAELPRQVLDGMIDALLVQQAAADLGIAPSAAEVDSQVQADITAVGGSPAFSEWLTATQQTEAQYRESVRSSITLRKVVAAVAGGVPVAGELVSVRRVEFGSLDSATSALAELRAGVDLSELAQDAAGALGQSWPAEPVWVTRGMIEEEAEAAVFSLEAGGVSSPMPLGDGRYALYQVVEHKPYAPFSRDVKIDLEALAFREWLSQRRADSAVERFAGP